MIRVIDWVDFAPLAEDTAPLKLGAGQSIHIRLLVRRMVLNCLKAYPWPGRKDLIPVFHPAATYQIGQAVAWPIVDVQGIRPDTWRSGRVKSVKVGENPIQGKFQVVQLVVDGKEYWLAAALEGAKPLVWRFPSDDDELDFLADEFVNAYLPQLGKIIDDLIASGKMNAIRQGDLVVFGRATQIHADFAPWFAMQPAEYPFLTMDDLIVYLWDVGELADTPEALARVLVEKTLRERGYVDAGGGRWIAPETLAAFDRQVSRRLVVPRNQSKIKAQMGEDEELDADDFVELPEPAQAFLQKLKVEDEHDESPAQPRAWTPPNAPLKMPALSYLNIMQGYFPLAGGLERAFVPRETPGLVDVTLVEGDALPFVVNLQEQTLKSVAPQAVYGKFVRELGIPAGTFLWLEYRGENKYRILARPLAPPRLVHCKQAWLDEDGELKVEEAEIPMMYDGDEHLFRAELRFENMDALFREADERDFSIFDAIYDVLPKLAALRPDGLAHVNDIFNAVFFEYRMCSYRTVIHELYDHACFAEAGDGFYRFIPSLGVKRRRPTRRQASKAFWREQKADDVGKSLLTGAEPEFWRRIAFEIPRKLHTLDEEKPFEITSVTHETIELTVSTGQPRSIPRGEVEQAWNELTQTGRIDRERVTKFANFNVAYVLAILARLPGVSYLLKPLRLMMGGGATARNTESADWEEERDKESEDDEKLVRAEKMRNGQMIAPDLLPPEPLFVSTPGDVGVQTPGEVQNLPILDARMRNPLRNARERAATAKGRELQIRAQRRKDARLYGTTLYKPSSDANDSLEYRAGDAESFAPGYPFSDAELLEYLNHLKGREILLQTFGDSVYIEHIGDGVLRLRYGIFKFKYGSGKQASILLEQISLAWNDLKSGKNLSLAELASYAPRKRSYLYAILAHFPYVAAKGVATSSHDTYYLAYRPPVSITPVKRDSGTGADENVIRVETAQEQDTIPAAAKAPVLSHKKPARPTKGDEMQAKTLFSNNFLNTRLAGMPEWQDDPLAALAQVRGLWQKATRYGENWNEAQTEDEFIKPLLGILGWSFIVQAKAGRGGQVTRPDYALFGDEASKQAAYPHQGNDAAFYNRALAIAEAKHWGRPLSQKDASGRATWKAESNPSHQMVSYLNGTRAEWGILTNGRAWRLYSREVSSTASEFYEVDLGDLFDFLPDEAQPSAEQVEAFKRWWLFFRRAAFVRETQGKTFVQRAHEGSALYAREISYKLKELCPFGHFKLSIKDLTGFDTPNQAFQATFVPKFSCRQKCLKNNVKIVKEQRRFLPNTQQNGKNNVSYLN